MRPFDFSRSPCLHSPMLLLGDILRRHARYHADKTAYVLGPARVDYAAFHHRSNQLARALQRLGVRQGDRVAVLANNCAEYPVIYFAAIKIGAIVVPLNARFRASEIAYVCNHSEAETLFVSAECAESIADLRRSGQLRSVRHVLGIDHLVDSQATLAEVATAESTDDIHTNLDENDPHVMLYTSGTTGAPKG